MNVFLNSSSQSDCTDVAIVSAVQHNYINMQNVLCTGKFNWHRNNIPLRDVIFWISQNHRMVWVDLCEDLTGPPLSLSTSFWMVSFPSRCVDCTTQLGIVSKLAEGAVDSTVHVTNKGVQQLWYQCLSLQNTAHYWSPLGHQAVDHNSLNVTTNSFSS